MSSKESYRDRNDAERRHKLRQHAVSLATGVGVFVAAVGLMQAVKPSAGNRDAVAVPNAAPEPRSNASSGSSGAGAGAAGAGDDQRDTAPAAPVPAAPAPTAPAPTASAPAAQAPAAPARAATRDTAAQIMGMPSVYIHVLNEEAREQARLLAPALEKKGIALAGIKIVSAGPRSSDLRYFRPSEREEAARVQAALLSLGLPAHRLKSISGFETSAVPRQYELWLASDYKG